MITHISFDLETWGNSPGHDLRSIGAVVFDPINGRVLADNCYINICDGNKYGLKRDPDTVQWWSDQSKEAQAAFETSPQVSLPLALDGFRRWLTWRSYNERELRLWCKGAHYDVPILEAAYGALRLSAPWHYRAPRDMRTALEMARMDPATAVADFATGTLHNALDDAVSQARAICEAYRRVGYGL